MLVAWLVALLTMAPTTITKLCQIADQTVDTASGEVFKTTGFTLEASLRCEYLGKVLDCKNSLHIGAAEDIVPTRARLLF